MSEHINPSTRIVRHISGGEAVEYACPFIIWNEAGIEVYIDDVLQASNSYRLEGIGEKSGCAVIFEKAPEKDAVVCFIGHTVRKRAVDYTQSVEEVAQEVRLKRNLLLAESDWTQLQDTQLPEDKKNAWTKYWQELRDLPQTQDVGQSVIWPDKPE